MLTINPYIDTNYKNYNKTAHYRAGYQLTALKNQPDIFFCSKKSKDYSDYDFVSKSDILFFNNIVRMYPNITKRSILDKLEKISKMDMLEGHNKLNLTEHVITKELHGETRDFDRLIRNIEYFSKNEKLNSVLIADSSKYTFEEPYVDMQKFNKILTYVIENACFKEPPNVMKVSKLILANFEKKEELFNLLSHGYTAPQLKFICAVPNALAQKLKNIEDLSELDTNSKYEYFKLLNFANDEVFAENMTDIFPTFPASNAAAEELKEQLKILFDGESPLVLGDIGVQRYFPKQKDFQKTDNKVINICAAIIKNNIPPEGMSAKTYYEQKAFQSIYDLDGYGLNYKQQNKICKIISAYGQFLEPEPNLPAIALLLRHRNCFEIFKRLVDDTDSENLKQLQRYVDFLKSNTNIIIQDDFSADKFTVKKFPDGTVNKIVEYNGRYHHNPKVILHSAGIELAGILPVEKTADKKSILINNHANRIFSASLLSEDDYKPFRTYGYVLSSDVEDILGGINYDFASGFDKNIESYGAKLLKENSEILSYFPNLLKKKYNISDEEYKNLLKITLTGEPDIINMILKSENMIGTTERIDGRKYNEFLIVNPYITGIFVYGDINSLPYEFRKFAQDNDLKILHIKTRNKPLKKIQF